MPTISKNPPLSPMVATTAQVSLAEQTSMASNPGLDSQLAILRGGEGWNSCSTALVNFAAEEMHVEGSLAPYELEAIQQPDWQKKCVDVPHHLKGIFNRIAEKIKTDPEFQKKAALLVVCMEKYVQQFPMWNEFQEKGYNSQEEKLNTVRLSNLRAEVGLLKSHDLLKPAAIDIEKIVRLLDGVKSTGVGSSHITKLNASIDVLADTILVLNNAGELCCPEAKEKLGNELEDALVLEVGEFIRDDKTTKLSSMVNKGLKEPLLEKSIKKINEAAFNEIKKKVASDLKQVVTAMEGVHYEMRLDPNSYVDPSKEDIALDNIRNILEQVIERVKEIRGEIKPSSKRSKKQSMNKLFSKGKEYVEKLPSTVKEFARNSPHNFSEGVKQVEAILKQTTHGVQAGTARAINATLDSVKALPMPIVEMNAAFRSSEVVLLAVRLQLENAMDQMMAVVMMAIKEMPLNKVHKSGAFSDDMHDKIERRKIEVASELGEASAEDDKLEIAVNAVLRELVEMRLEPEAEDENKQVVVQEQLKAVNDKMFQVVKAVKDEAVLNELGDKIKEVQAHVPRELEREADKNGQELKSKLTPVVEKLKKAANELEVASITVEAYLDGRSSMVEKGDRDELEKGLEALRGAKRKLDAVKSETKQAYRDVTGKSLDSFSRTGRLAKSIGEWICTAKEEFLKDHNGANKEEVDKVIKVLKSQILADFATKEDPKGIVLSRLVDLAEKDAQNGTLLWYATAKEVLGRTPEIGDYLARWGEKSIGFGAVSALASGVAGNDMSYLVSVNPRRNILRPRLGYLKVLMTPIVIRNGIKDLMKSVQPGMDKPEREIKELIRKEVFKTSFRLASSLLPPGLRNLMALPLVVAGLYRGGEYRKHFIKRAASRLPMDALYSAGFEAYRALSTKEAPSIQHTMKKSEVAIQGKEQTKPDMNKAAPSLTDLGGVIEPNVLPKETAGSLEDSFPQDNNSVDLNAPKSRFRRNTSDGGTEYRINLSTFNKLFSSWRNGEDISGDEHAHLYMPIFNAPLSSDDLSPGKIEKLRDSLGDDFQSQARYVYRVVTALEAKSWPVEFSTIESSAKNDRKLAEKEIKIANSRIADLKAKFPVHSSGLAGSSIREAQQQMRYDRHAKPEIKRLNDVIAKENVKLAKAEAKLTILENLRHVKNPRLSNILEGDFKKLETLYSEKNQIVNELNKQKIYAASLNSSGYSAVRVRNVDAAIRETNDNIDSLIKRFYKNDQAINAMRVASEVDSLASLRQVSVANEVDTIALESTPLLEGVSGLAEVGKDRYQKIDQLILDKLAKQGIEIDATQLGKKHNVLFVQGANFGGQASFATERRSFSLRQILLGEADRSIFIHIGSSQTISNIDCDQANLKEFLNNKHSRLNIADAVMADVKKTVLSLADDPQMLDSYKATALGTIISTLANSAEGIKGKEPIYQQIVDAFVNGVIQPEPVLFKNQVVPDLFALGRGDYRIMISVKKGGLLLFNDQTPSAALPGFIKDHLSQMEQGKFRNSDVQPALVIDPNLGPSWSHKLGDFYSHTSITRRDGEVLDPYRVVLQANLEKIISDVGALIYTSDEKRSKLNNDMGKVLTQSADLLLMLATSGASAGVKTLVGSGAGVGFGLTDIVLDQQIVDSADRYEDVQAAEQSMLLGKIFLAVNVAVPLVSSVKGSGSGLDALTDLVTSGKNKIEKLRGTFNNTWDKMRPGHVEPVANIRKGQVAHAASTSADEIGGGVQESGSLRAPVSEKLRIIDSVQELNQFDKYKFKLQENPVINQMISSPNERCKDMMGPASQFMKENGFTDIQYRGMFMWANGMDNMPSTHFAVIGSKNGERVVFDLTAHQFANRGMHTLSDPLIMTEDAWAKKFQSATKTKLIKYKDFDNPSDAGIAFHPTQRPMPTDVMEGGTRLTEPGWYKSVALNPAAGVGQNRVGKPAGQQRAYINENWKPGPAEKGGRPYGHPIQGVEGGAPIQGTNGRNTYGKTVSVPKAEMDELGHVVNKNFKNINKRVFNKDYAVRDFDKIETWLPAGHNSRPDAYVISGHGQTIDTLIDLPPNTRVNFYSDYGKSLPDAGLTTRKNPIARLTNNGLEVPHIHPDMPDIVVWKPAYNDELARILGTTQKGKFRDMKLFHFEADSPGGAIDTWKLNNATANRAAVVVKPGESIKLSEIMDLSPKGLDSPTDFYVNACRDRSFSAWAADHHLKGGVGLAVGTAFVGAGGYAATQENNVAETASGNTIANPDIVDGVDENSSQHLNKELRAIILSFLEYKELPKSTSKELAIYMSDIIDLFAYGKGANLPEKYPATKNTNWVNLLAAGGDYIKEAGALKLSSEDFASCLVSVMWRETPLMEQARRLMDTNEVLLSIMQFVYENGQFGKEELPDYNRGKLVDYISDIIDVFEKGSYEDLSKKYENIKDEHWAGLASAGREYIKETGDFKPSSKDFASRLRSIMVDQISLIVHARLLVQLKEGAPTSPGV